LDFCLKPTAREGGSRNRDPCSPINSQHLPKAAALDVVAVDDHVVEQQAG
jgi:hypothetical protein